MLEKRADITLNIVDAELYDKTESVIKSLCNLENVHRMSEPECFEEQAKAVAQQDAYYGDQGPVTWMFQHFHKPIQINTVDYNKQ